MPGCTKPDSKIVDEITTSSFSVSNYEDYEVAVGSSGKTPLNPTSPDNGRLLAGCTT